MMKLDEVGKPSRIGQVAYPLSVVLISLCYTILRFSLNVEYPNAPWIQIFNFQAPVPFGYRILIPVLSHPVVFFGFSIKDAFMFWEFIASVLLVIGLYRVFNLHVEKRWAKTFSIAFIFTLPLLYLLRFRWPIYYPSDTIAIAFVVWGTLFVLERKWIVLSFLLLFSTLNRESSILIPMVFSVVCIDRLQTKKFVYLLLWLSSIYFLVRWGLILFTEGNPHPYQGSMAYLFRNQWRVNYNIVWLMSPGRVLLFLSTFGWLPLACYWLREHIPAHLGRFHIVVFVYFSMLCFIGNLYEPRIYGEIAVLLYIVLALALYGYLQGTMVEAPPRIATRQGHSRVLFLVDRVEPFVIVVMTIAVCVIVFTINRLGPQYFFTLN